MAGDFSGMVKEAIELIWKAFDKEKASKGYRLLLQAAEGGDADAYCFLDGATWGRNLYGTVQDSMSMRRWPRST